MEFKAENIYPEYDISVINGKAKVTFYCSMRHSNITIDLYDFHEEEVLEKAWSMARIYFNRCHQCCNWVCDEHYNEDVMKCILCQPKY